MKPATQRRGAICAALGVIACAGLLVLWAGRDPPAPRPVRNERGDDGVPALAAPARPPAKSATTTSLLGKDSSTDETGVGDRDTLVVALGDADADVRADAVADLGLIHDTQVEWLLAITAMQDPAPAVRVEALYALESLRAESRLAAFRHALGDSDADVRKAAIGALEDLEGDEDLKSAR